MDKDIFYQHRLINTVQSVLLLAAMAALLGALGWFIWGGIGAVLALAVGAVLILVNPVLSPKLILRMYRARPLSYEQAPQFHALLQALAERADLPRPPALYYVPSTMINAFAVGSRGNAAVALTDGLFRRLNAREVGGVLAHEVSHIQNNDMWVMGLADMFSRLTNTLSTIGQLLLLLNLPLLLFSSYTMSWWAILLLIFAPSITALMQLALSRTREYDADLNAARLLGDPRALASALAKMERFQGRIFEQVFMPGRRVPEPSLLRTHPPTEERIRRLMSLQKGAAVPEPWPRLEPPRPARALPRDFFTVLPRRPRLHVSGIWY